MAIFQSTNIGNGYFQQTAEVILLTTIKLYIQMGNGESVNSEGSPQKWQYYGNHNGIDLYRRADGLILEKRKITLDHRFDLASQKKIYKMRENNQHGFVKVFEVVGVEDKKKKSQFCSCNPTTTMIVYSERIQNRLSDLPQLSFPESLKILYAATLAFSRLYEEFMPFHINGELIGINLDGEVRVWLNQNWALNHPSHQISYHKTMSESNLPIELRNQNEMINNLLQIMEEKTEHGRFPQPFLQEVYQNSGSWRKLKKYLASVVENKQRELPRGQHTQSTIGRAKQIRHDEVRYEDPRQGSRMNFQPIDHVQTIQSTYVPQEQPKNTPVFGQKINGSVILPAGYIPSEPKTYSKPAVSFDHKPAPSQFIAFQHSPHIATHNQTSFTMEPRPVMEHRPPMSQPTQSLTAATSSSYPRFRLVNESSSNVHNSIEPLPSKQTATSFEGRDPQLEEIRRMLRQDISEMSSHQAQYKVDNAGPK